MLKEVLQSTRELLKSKAEIVSGQIDQFLRDNFRGRQRLSILHTHLHQDIPVLGSLTLIGGIIEHSTLLMFSSAALIIGNGIMFMMHDDPHRKGLPNSLSHNT